MTCIHRYRSFPGLARRILLCRHNRIRAASGGAGLRGRVDDRHGLPRHHDPLSVGDQRRLRLDTGFLPDPKPAEAGYGGIHRPGLVGARLERSGSVSDADDTKQLGVFQRCAAYGSSQFVYIQKLYELGITGGTVGPTINSSGVLTAQGQFAPASTLVNYQIAIFLDRARSLADYGCTAAYYAGALKPFPCSV